MALISIPDKNVVIEDFSEISDFLNSRGIFIEKWSTPQKIAEGDSQEKILAAYEHKLKPFMTKNDFKSADVVHIHKNIKDIEKIRQKFLQEHTHSENEVRFFVDGKGVFWFHQEGEVFSVLCEKVDFISVPQGVKHWFDIAPDYFVVAIRIFTSTEGWTPLYTQSKIEQKYIKDSISE